MSNVRTWRLEQEANLLEARLRGIVAEFRRNIQGCKRPRDRLSTRLALVVALKEVCLETMKATKNDADSILDAKRDKEDSP